MIFKRGVGGIFVHSNEGGVYMLVKKPAAFVFYFLYTSREKPGTEPWAFNISVNCQRTRPISFVHCVLEMIGLLIQRNDFAFINVFLIKGGSINFFILIWRQKETCVTTELHNHSDQQLFYKGNFGVALFHIVRYILELK